MKIIDKNGRLFGKISVIDVLVLAVVAVMVVAVYVKTNQNPITSTATPNDTITFQIKLNGVRTYVADAIRVGDQLWDQDRSSGGALGKITAIQTEPGVSLTVFSDGTIGPAPVEDGVNLLLTLEGSGLISDGRYLLNRVYDLGVNSSRGFQTKYVQFNGTVVDIL